MSPQPAFLATLERRYDGPLPPAALRAAMLGPQADSRAAQAESRRLDSWARNVVANTAKRRATLTAKAAAGDQRLAALQSDLCFCRRQGLLI